MADKVVVVWGASLLPPETLQAVIEASPSAIPHTGRKTAREVLNILIENSGDDQREYDLNGNPFYAMYIKEIVEKYESKQIAEVHITPRWMGEVLAGFGIKSRHRRNDGFIAMWTRKQLDILSEHFKA